MLPLTLGCQVFAVFLQWERSPCELSPQDCPTDAADHKDGFEYFEPPLSLQLNLN